jgi:uroporphyrinogen-III synthase
LTVRLLVTRPDGERTAADLRARGHEPILAPLLRIEPIAEADLGGAWVAVVLTSANAARALALHPRCTEVTALPAFAVGGRSAQAAREVGFTDVASADGDVTDLAGLIVERIGTGMLLYLAGEDRAGDLAGELGEHGLDVRTVVTYRATPAGSLPQDARAALAAGRIDGALHYSRRSAEVFVDAARRAGVLGEALALVHYCLSAQVAEPLAEAGASAIRTARRPDEAALLELLDRP